MARTPRESQEASGEQPESLFVGIGARRTSPVVDARARVRLGTELRALYTALEAQPIPDRIIVLLEELDRSGHGTGRR